MVHILSLAMASVGLFYSIRSIRRNLSYSGEGADKTLEARISESLKQAKLESERLEAVLKDYEILHVELQRRENIMLAIGSILIAASLLILGQTALSANAFSSFDVNAFASIGLFSLWIYILHESSKKLDGLTYKRAKAIEKALSYKLDYQFGIHSYIEENTSKSGKPKLWLRVRRIFWYTILGLLNSAWWILALVK
jgi:hypothetical protein